MTILSAFLINIKAVFILNLVSRFCFLNQVSWLSLLQGCPPPQLSRLFASSIEQGCPPPQLIVKAVSFNWLSIWSSSIDPQGRPLPQSIIKTVCFPSWLSRLFASSIECQGYLLPRLSVQSSVKIGDFHQESRLSPYIKCWGCPLQSSVEVVCFNHV